MGINFLNKTKMNKYLLVIGLSLATLFIGGCSKKNSLAPIATGQLYFHLHTNIDDVEVGGYNSVIQSASGRNVSLSLAQMYISTIELVKLDGSVYAVPNKVILTDFETETYLIGNVPAGNYKSIRFSVGLNGAQNAKTPVSGDSVFYHPEMWFGNTAQPMGYVFLNVQGKIDTTAQASGTEAQMVPFSYRIGTLANSRQVDMPDQNFAVLPDQDEYAHFTVNIMRIFDGVDLSKTHNLTVQSPTDNSNTLAILISNNIPNLFYYE